MVKKQEVLNKEELEAMGQESDRKASKWIKEKTNERIKKEDEEEYKTADKLKKRVGNFNLYNDSLKAEAKKRIATYDIPQGYYIDVQLTSKGLAFGYKHLADKMWFMRGMKITGNPIYDLNGIDRKINEAMDEIELRIQGKSNLHKTAGGLVLPN